MDADLPEGVRRRTVVHGFVTCCPRAHNLLFIWARNLLFLFTRPGAEAPPRPEPLDLDADLPEGCSEEIADRLVELRESKITMELEVCIV